MPAPLSTQGCEGGGEAPARDRLQPAGASEDKIWSWFHSPKTLGLLAMYVLNAYVKINIVTKIWLECLLSNSEHLADDTLRVLLGATFIKMSVHGNEC